jgi:hypothetical protein
MGRQTRQFVRRRANHRCEYCHLPQAGHDERFSIDHVIASQHVRDDSTSNLAFSCLRCNLFKGTNVSGIDPMSGQITLLFNPRIQLWHQHFRWNGPVLSGLSPEARASIALMQMNAPARVQLRQTLVVEGLLVLD